MATKSPSPLVAIIRELETARALGCTTNAVRYYATLDRVAVRLTALRHSSRPVFADAPTIVTELQDLVARTAGLTRAQLIAPGNLRPLAQPRGLAIALCRELLPYGCELVGAWFGGRHHSAVLTAERVHRDRLATDSNYAALTADLRAAALLLIRDREHRAAAAQALRAA